MFFLLQISHISLDKGFNVEEAAVIKNFRCLFYPTNIFNCSWSFDTLHADTQLSFYFRCFYMTHSSFSRAFFFFFLAFINMNIHLPDTLQYLSCFELSFFCSFSICDGETAVHSLNEPSVGRAGSVVFSPPSTHEHEMYVILQFNFTLQDKWTVYTYKYSRDMLGNTV